MQPSKGRWKLTLRERSASICSSAELKAFRGIGATLKFLAVTSVLCGVVLCTDVHANDFPTQARVEYVLRCMESHGGQKYENMYSCVCTIDKIADEITYDEFVEGEVFAQLRATPGERGSVFRDPDRASLLVRKLTEITEIAEQSCFVNLGTGAT